MRALFIYGLVVLGLFACNNEPGHNHEHNHQLPEGITESIGTAGTVEMADGNITITADDNMNFNVREIRVKAGQETTLTLLHIGKASREAMGHNFVLLKKGVTVEDFAPKAIEASDNEYIPKNTTDVLVHTRMLGGGESDTIKFKAPAKGEYEFLCSFPGHASLMRGLFIVE
ncbi:MAG: azurin [Niabella sp.]